MVTIAPILSGLSAHVGAKFDGLHVCVPLDPYFIDPLAFGCLEDPSSPTVASVAIGVDELAGGDVLEEELDLVERGAVPPLGSYQAEVLAVAEIMLASSVASELLAGLWLVVHDK